MASACIYENEKDGELHSRAIRRLAMDSGVAEEKIRVLYLRELCSLREGSRIKDYLVILVSRLVKDMIKGGVFGSQTS